MRTAGFGDGLFATAAFPLGAGTVLWDVVDGLIGDARGDLAGAPAAGLKETDKAFVLGIDMPGVAKEDLDIRVEGDRVRVKALRKNPLGGDGEEGRTLLKDVALPRSVDREGVRAHLENGVLYLALPKSPGDRARRVEVSGKADAPPVLERILGEGRDAGR